MTPETTWIVLRAAGLVALAAFTLSVASGLAGPAVSRPSLRGLLVAGHRSLAVTGLALTVAHVLLAVVDPYVDVSLLAAVLPGASRWQPLWTGVGAVALNLLAVVGLSSAMRGRGPRAWWTLHALTYPAWLLSAAHGLAMGSDTTGQAFRVSALTGIALVAVAALARWRAVRGGAPVGVPARTALPVGGRP